MQQYIYTAKSKDGSVVKAEVEAASIKDATKLLKSKDLFVTDIKEKSAKNQFGFIDKLNRIKFKDKVVFTRQLATMIKAGLPLAQALRMLEEQTDKPKMKEIIKGVINNIEGGSTLSQSLAQYPEVFNHVYISMVESGETSGNLEEVLLRLADQEEKTQQINSKIRSAFIYPAIVLVVLVFVSFLMLTMVLPQVGSMYKDLHQALPWFSSILIALGHILTKFWYITVLILIGLGYGAYMYIKSPQGRSTWDRLKYTMPPINVLIQELYMARFARTLGSLVASGVPILQALAIVSKSINNVHYEAEINKITVGVKAGGALSEQLAGSILFLPLMAQMISVGEKTGTLGDSLGKTADYYEDEVDEAIKNISTLIEPATMVLLGLMVAFLIAAVLLPIYGLVTVVGRQ